jgi:hypothetical protein
LARQEHSGQSKNTQAKARTLRPKQEHSGQGKNTQAKAGTAASSSKLQSSEKMFSNPLKQIKVG